MSKSDQQAMATVYIMRLYDHIRRKSSIQTRRSTRQDTIGTSRSHTGNSRDINVSGREWRGQSRNVNYGNAQDFEIWEVARAATAAPLYFEPLEIEIPGRPERMLFTDGGFNYTNNPTIEGTKDIEEAHKIHSINVVVSVGTARKNERPGENGLFPLYSKGKGLAHQLTDPEVVHREMTEKSGRDGFQYYRLNDPGRLDLELDQWEPKRSRYNRSAGSTTIQSIAKAFNEWAGERANHRDLEKYAALLVRCRKARVSNASMWERYATGCQFTCRFTGCDREDFLNRDLFRAHLRNDHPSREQNDENREVEECRKSWQYQSAGGH